MNAGGGDKASHRSVSENGNSTSSIGSGQEDTRICISRFLLNRARIQNHRRIGDTVALGVYDVGTRTKRHNGGAIDVDSRIVVEEFIRAFDIRVGEECKAIRRRDSCGAWRDNGAAIETNVCALQRDYNCIGRCRSNGGRVHKIDIAKCHSLGTASSDAQGRRRIYDGDLVRRPIGSWSGSSTDLKGSGKISKLSSWGRRETNVLHTMVTVAVPVTVTASEYVPGRTVTVGTPLF